MTGSLELANLVFTTVAESSLWRVRSSSSPERLFDIAGAGFLRVDGRLGMGGAVSSLDTEEREAERP